MLSLLPIFLRPSALIAIAAIWLASGALLSTASLHAEPLALTADSAVARALADNPDLLAARTAIAEAEARAHGAGRLANSELSTELAGGAHSHGRAEIGLTQRFPFTARLRLERSLAALHIELARLEIAHREWQLAAATRTACVELLAAREALALAAPRSALAEDLARALGDQAAAGQASPLDAGQARLTAQTIAHETTALRIAETAATARLAALLGLDPTPPLTLALTGTLDLPPAPPDEPPAAPRPDLALAERAVAAGEAGVALARTTRWDDLAVGVFVESERTRDDSTLRRSTENLLGVRLSVPLPVRQNAASTVLEKQAARQRLTRELAALRLAARHEAAATFQAMRARHDAAHGLATALLPAARAHLADTEAAHRRGEIDAQPVFRARESLASLERAALDARVAYHLARISWLAASGHLLPSP